VGHAGFTNDLVVEIHDQLAVTGNVRRKLEAFLAYIWLACSGTVTGQVEGPSTRACLPHLGPGFVTSQLPPVSAARSTITAPGFIPRTASAVIRTGARFRDSRGS